MNLIAKMLQVYFIAGTQDCRLLNGQPEQNLLSILHQALAHGHQLFPISRQRCVFFGVGSGAAKATGAGLS